MAPVDPGGIQALGEEVFLRESEVGLLFQSDWLRDALQFSLRAKWSTSSIQQSVSNDLDPPLQRDPRFRKLVDGILFSRRFVLTYHLVILGFIAAVTVSYWSAKWSRSRRKASHIRKDEELDYAISTHRKPSKDAPVVEIASSSGSSTLEGIQSRVTKIVEVDEGTILLKDCRPPRTTYLHQTIWSNIKSFLIYQPPPMPIPLQRHKILPSMGTLIVIAAFVGLNMFYTLYHISFNIVELFVLADRCGLVFVMNLPLLYLLSAKTQPLQSLTGYSYESLNIFHRRLGEILCVEAAFHAVGMAGVWYTLLSPIGFTLKRFIFNKTILTGIGAFVVYELLFFTARPWFRHIWYEMFLGLHVVLQAAALMLLYFHHHASRIYVGIAIGIFVTDRLLYRILLKTTRIVAEARVMDDGDTIRLSAVVDLRRKNILSQLVGNPTGGWQAADHVFLTVPSLGRKHIFQAHPFTIASPAPTENTEKAKLDLLIRAQDGFSLDLLEIVAKGQSSLILRIDGPYGAKNARTLLVDADIAIVVAGGSGIAVAWPLIHALLDRRPGTHPSVASESELPKKRIALVWVVHRNSHTSWIGQSALQDIANKGVEVIIPQATEEVGRPDLEAIIDGLVNQAELKMRIGVVGSGPDSMGRSVRNTCASLVRNGRRVEVAIEKFGW